MNSSKSEAARRLDPAEVDLLKLLFDATPSDGSWVNARKFRATNHASIELIQCLEDDQFILREQDTYRLSLTALASLDDERARSVLEACDKLLPALQHWYIEHQTEQLPVAVLAEQTGLPLQATLESLRYFLEAFGWCSGRSSAYFTDVAPSLGMDEGIVTGGSLQARLEQLVGFQRTRIGQRLALRKFVESGASRDAVESSQIFHEFEATGRLPSAARESSRTLAETAMASLFFSYSHEDEQYRDQLEKHLAPLKHEGLIEAWHDRRILAGADLGAEIDRQLEQADVILLLVSASFLASTYCYGIEMKRALEKNAAGTATVIPVIVRPCDWQKSPLGVLMAAPKDGKAITTWANYDEAYADVARKVREVVEHMAKRTPIVATAATRAAPPAVSGASQVTPLPRSSNLRLRREFSEADRDKYLHDSFEFMAQFFEGSLQELEARHADVEARFRRIDADKFVASIFRKGKKEAECAVNRGGAFREGGISYSSNPSSRGNSFNEVLSVKSDDQMLFLEPMGISSPATKAKLPMDQAAEFYWEMLISSLQ